MPNIFKQGDWGKSLELGMNMRKQMDNQKLLQEQAQQRQAEFNMKMEEFKLKLQEQRQKKEDADKLNASFETDKEKLGGIVGKDVAGMVNNPSTYNEVVKGLISNAMKPEATNEWTILQKAAEGNPIAQKMLEMKRSSAQTKPLNMEVAYDTLGASYFPDYSTNPESQKAWNAMFTEKMKTPEGQKELASRRQAITPPSYVFPMTDQGLVPVISRGAGAGAVQQPTGLQKPIPISELSKNAGLEALLTDIGKVKTLYGWGTPQKRSDWVGPIAGRTGELRERYTGGASTDQVTFYSYVRDMKDALLRARSGAQINEQEYKRLVGFLPDEKINSKSFEARLQRFEDELNNILSTKQKVFGAGGYGSSNLGGGQTARPPLSSFMRK
jgi:hypothetical protein